MSVRITTVVLSLQSLSLSVGVSWRFTADTLRYAVTLTLDPMTLTIALKHF